MKRFFPLILFYISTISTVFAGEPHRHYLNANFGIGNFESPVVYNYSLNYTIDLSISKKSNITLGLEWDNFFQQPYNIDTIYPGSVSLIGADTYKINVRNHSVMSFNPSFGYKYWVMQNVSNAMYLEGKLNLIFAIRDVYKYEVYSRDTNQVLYGPTAVSSGNTESEELLMADGFRPGLTIGYLKKINEHLDWHFKLDVLFSIPNHNSNDLALFYPKLGVGLAFH